MSWPRGSSPPSIGRSPAVSSPRRGAAHADWAAAPTAVLNAFTVDLEDWAHGLLGGETPVTTRVLQNVDRVLALLDAHDVQATFFALGKVCEKFPRILRLVAEAGHEIGSHGYGHKLLYQMKPAEFREDLHRSVQIIAEQTGRRPIGYRAPAFSLTRQTLWAGPMLLEMGFQYSSSIFPFAGPRYGIGDAPRHPFQWRHWSPTSSACRLDGSKGDLTEFPLTILEFRGRRWPVSGGGYLRLLPTFVLKTAIRQANRLGQPAVVYIHPYELDVHEVRDLTWSGWRFPRCLACKQALFRRSIPGKLHDILRHLRFASMREVLGL